MNLQFLNMPRILKRAVFAKEFTDKVSGYVPFICGHIFWYVSYDTCVIM
jgi:hypothetical protein